MRKRYSEFHYGAACSCEPWYDGKNIYIAIDEFDPGSAMSCLRRHRAWLIPKTPDNEYRVDEFFDSVVFHLMNEPNTHIRCIADTQKSQPKKKPLPFRRQENAEIH